MRKNDQLNSTALVSERKVFDESNVVLSTTNSNIIYIYLCVSGAVKPSMAIESNFYTK